MVLFHGSENIIERPVFGFGKRHNDYGLGFYCTKDCDLAMEWAVDENRNGYANQYDFDSAQLKILDLSNDYSILSWIAILIENRTFEITSPIAREAKSYLLEKFRPDYDEYDVIKGYRADDSYFSFARDFLNNTISLEQLNAAILYGNLGEQIVIKSEKAFERLSFISALTADYAIYYPQKNNRDKKARQQYFGLDKHRYNKGETYVFTILEREMTTDDLRI